MKYCVLSLICMTLLAGCSSDRVKQQENRQLNWNQLSPVSLIEGMRGAENIYMPADSSRIYVTDLSGMVYLLDDNEQGKLEVQASLKVGNTALGIAEGKDGYLYVNASEHDTDNWLTLGGALYQVDKELRSAMRVSGDYPGINGLTRGPEGALYFATGNLRMFSPRGALYKLEFDAVQHQYSAPQPLLLDIGSANGMLYHEHSQELLFSETFSKVSSFDLATQSTSELFGKTRLVEGFDDLCVDSKGRIWVTEPVAGFLKMYERDSMKLTRIRVDGLGVASSCATAMRWGEEHIFVTEREINNNDDGRGLAVIPIRLLLANSETN